MKTTKYISKHTQLNQMPKIDLTRLKEMTESDWQAIVDRIPFTGHPFENYRDYTDGINVKMTNHIFKPRIFKTAKESGMSMLRTLNFMQ